VAVITRDQSSRLPVHILGEGDPTEVNAFLHLAVGYIVHGIERTVTIEINNLSLEETAFKFDVAIRSNQRLTG
jgi:hypothetical protein